MRLITARGQLTGGLPAGTGAMAAVLAPVEEVRAAVEPLGEWLAIAAVNGPESVVISGRLAELGAICDRFAERGYRVERLRVSHAFHSPLMEEAARELAKEASKVVFREPDVRLISTVTGRAVGCRELSQGEYWRRQVRDGVLFEPAMKEVENCQVFVEIGPGSTLLGLGRGLIAGDERVWVASIRRKRTSKRSRLPGVSLCCTPGASPWIGRPIRRGGAVVASRHPLTRSNGNTTGWTRGPHSRRSRARRTSYSVCGRRWRCRSTMASWTSSTPRESAITASAASPRPPPASTWKSPWPSPPRSRIPIGLRSPT